MFVAQMVYNNLVFYQLFFKIQAQKIDLNLIYVGQNEKYEKKRLVKHFRCYILMTYCWRFHNDKLDSLGKLTLLTIDAFQRQWNQYETSTSVTVGLAN